MKDKYNELNYFSYQPQLHTFLLFLQYSVSLRLLYCLCFKKKIYLCLTQVQNSRSRYFSETEFARCFNFILKLNKPGLF